MTITLKQLRLMGACEPQVALFKERFGTSVELTEVLMIEHGKDFDLSWIAAKVFTPEQYADYEAKRDVLYADYRAKCAPLDADYKAKRDVLYADYDAKYASLDADYRAKCALAFWAIAREAIQ